VNERDDRHRSTGQIEVAELRERLRALGYLNAGVDRFVLAPAQRERRAWILTVLVSLRIGLVAALLLGPAAAIGLASRLPGLITGARDVLVVTAYLAVVFGLGAGAASLAAAFMVRAIAARVAPATARRVAIGSGVVVGLGCLLYLTLWWNATGSGWAAPVRTAVAILAAVFVSLLLGHAVAVAALGLVARERQTLRAPVMSWRTILGIASAAFFAASALLVFSARVATVMAPPAFAVVPTGVRVVLIGIDGFDPQLYARWRKGDVPATPVLDRLGTSAGSAEGATDPATTWTTIATGVPPSKHGVTGMQARRVVGLQGSVDSGAPLARALGGATDLLRLTSPAPVSGLARRYKMLWEVAAEKGLDAAVVNWWATWPATGTSAVVLSDRAVLRLETGGEPSAEFSPPDIYAPLRQRWPEIARTARAMGSAFASLPDRTVADVLARSAALDAQQALLARDPVLESPDLLAVYLPGLDIAQHELLQGNVARAAPPSVLAERVAMLPRYYAFLDRLIAETLLANLPRHAVVILVAHPGRVGGTRGAVLSMSGGPLRGNADANVEMSLEDVAPTALYLLGLPVSRELTGQVRTEMVDPEFVRRYPVRYVETYGRYSPEVAGSDAPPLDKEMLERLRSLGYIR
jgi:hypothetical protein